MLWINMDHSIHNGNLFFLAKNKALQEMGIYVSKHDMYL
jgi:hypothetical protein